MLFLKKGEVMSRNKRVAVLLFLLLLLIILCIWCKSHKILNNQIKESSKIKTEQPVITKKNQTPISFHLQKNEQGFELSGQLVNQHNITNIIDLLGKNKLQNGVDIDVSLLDNPKAMLLIEQLLPIFSKQYNKGFIDYSNHKLTVEGIVQNERDKNKISTLLANSTIASQNNTQVHFIPTEPIFYTVVKENGIFTIEGKLQNKEQQKNIEELFKKEQLQSQLKINSKLMPSKSILLISEQLIKVLQKEYQWGKVSYQNQHFTIEGTVDSIEKQHLMDKLLEELALPFTNNTKIVLPQEVIEKRVKETEKKEPLKNTLEEATLSKEAIEVENEIKKIVKLEKINFSSGQSILTKKSKESILKISKTLIKHPLLHVEIAGHTDSSGDEKLNLELSQSRVNSVKKSLMKLGIASYRMKAIGYGETKALVSNDTPENKRINRRVEFKILGE